MAKKNEKAGGNRALMKVDLYRLHAGLKAVMAAGYGCSDLAIQVARNFRRVNEEIEDLEKTREPKSEKFEEYVKEEAALFRLHGKAQLGPGGVEQHTVPAEKQADLISGLNALKKKFSKAIKEQEEKNKKFDEMAQKAKVDVRLKTVSEDLIKKEVPTFSSAHALGILDMIDE